MKKEKKMLLIDSKLSSPESFSFNKTNNSDRKGNKTSQYEKSNCIQKHTTKSFKIQCI